MGGRRQSRWHQPADGFAVCGFKATLARHFGGELTGGWVLAEDARASLVFLNLNAREIISREALFILRDLRATKAINARSEKSNSRSAQWPRPLLGRVVAYTLAFHC